MNAKELREQYEKEVDQVTGEISYVQWLESRLAESKKEVERLKHDCNLKDDLFRELDEAAHEKILALTAEVERREEDRVRFNAINKPIIDDLTRDRAEAQRKADALDKLEIFLGIANEVMICRTPGLTGKIKIVAYFLDKRGRETEVNFEAADPCAVIESIIF